MMPPKLITDIEYEYNQKTNQMIERHANQIEQLRAELAAAKARLGIALSEAPVDEGSYEQENERLNAELATAKDVSAYRLGQWSKAEQAAEEAAQKIAFVKEAVCTSPFPLRCPVCKRGNKGIGFDFCLLAADKPERERAGR